MLGGMWGPYIHVYMYDGEEENAQKVKDRHNKERERRKEQSKKRVPYEPFVTLNGLQGATHLNGQ